MGALRPLPLHKIPPQQVTLPTPTLPIPTPILFCCLIPYFCNVSIINIAKQSRDADLMTFKTDLTSTSGNIHNKWATTSKNITRCDMKSLTSPIAFCIFQKEWQATVLLEWPNATFLLRRRLARQPLRPTCMKRRRFHLREFRHC